MKDLTVIMPTANKVPKGWAKYHREHLSNVIGDTPIITLSFEPTDWGTNIIQEEYGLLHLYKQLLIAAKAVETPFLAIAEDDTLYPREHFEYRPEGRVVYNNNKYSLFTWGKPMFYRRNNMTNSCMIAPTDMFVTALQERFDVHGDDVPPRLLCEVGRNWNERRFGVTATPSGFFNVEKPVVILSHEFGFDSAARNKRKVRNKDAHESLEDWGTAKSITKKFV